MPIDGSTKTRELPWVIVRVGRSRLGVPSGMVREMMALPTVARVPGLPPDLPGVITWRGQVVPLVDLRVRLQEPGEAGGATGPRMSVVVSPGPGERERAFAVDGIDGVEALEHGSHSQLPDGLEQKSGMVKEFGRLRRDGSLVLLLDVREALGIALTESDEADARMHAHTACDPDAATGEVSEEERAALVAATESLAIDAGDESSRLVPQAADAEPASEGSASPAIPRAHRARTSATPRSTSSGRGSRSPRRRTAS